MVSTSETDDNIIVETASNKRSGRNRLACVLIVLVVLLSLIIVLCVTIKARVVLVIFPDKPIVPDNDNREYRVIQVKNSIKATLIYDPTTRTASTSFNVAAGSLCNPNEVLGLAHYLEHMLFMGTKKYPMENEADKFASDNDGWINAWTDDSNTNYHFLVENSGLQKMTDIYAQFFISPLLKKDALEREMLAVESEYMMGFSSNFWPEYELMISLADPKSPYSRFSTGSISTLNRTDIQDKLWEFYDRYYSANLITVAIIGNETLDTLQQWAEEIFTSIPNKEKAKPVFNMLPFPPGNKDYISRRVYYQPKSDKDSLKLIFPVNIRQYPNLSYITYLLGYEGKGSLFQYLSTKGYITSLISSISVEAQNFVLVAVYCDLTEKGLLDPNFIIEAFFRFIKRVKVNGINEELWQENKKIDELKFKFKEKEDPASYASTISANMAKRDDPRDYLEPPSRRIYNKTLEEEIMSYITPDNFNMYLSSLKLSIDVKTAYGPRLEALEKWYSTPYANTPLFSTDIENWENVELDDDLHLPEANIFIPADFRMLEQEGGPLPVLVDNATDMTVWWYQDNEFSQPKIYTGCRVQPQQKDPTMRNQLLSEMLAGMYNIETSASLYPAISVDYNLALIFGNVWVLWLAGFSDTDKVKKVIESGLDSLFELDFEQDTAHFNATVREPIRKDYLNVKNWMPAQLTQRYARMLQDKFVFDYPEALDTIDTLSQSDVKELRDTFLDDISIDCSIMGNVLRAQALEYAEIVKTKLVTGGSANVVKEDRLDDYTYPVYKLPKNKTLIIRKTVLNPDEPNSGVLTQFQIGPIESNGPYADKPPYTRNMLVTLLGLMLREPCFNYLRTQMQLGYVASCFDEEYKDIQTFNMLVQGSREDAGADVIANEMDKFIQLQFDKFNESRNTDDGLELWTDIKFALQKQLEEKPISLSEKNGQFNREIFSSTRDFDRKSKKVAALSALTLDDFLEFYQRYLMSDQRRKISSQVYGKDHVPSDVVDASKGEELITDITVYRNNNLSEQFQDDE